jgi:putative inorganic carbon (hco3(-)) transporter
MNAGENINMRSILVLGLVLVLVLLSTYAITVLGDQNGLLVAGLIVGGALAVFTCVNFRFGFYFAIILGFLIFVADRLLGPEVPTAILVDIQINATFVGLIINRGLKRQSFFENAGHIITYGYLVYTLFLVIELFNPNASSIGGWFFVFRKFLQFLMIYFIALNVFDSLKRIRFFFIFWAACAFVAGIYGCYQQWFGFQEFELNWIWSVPGRAGLYSLDNGDFRKFSILSGPAAYGIIMAASGLLFAVLGTREKTSVARIGFLSTSVFCILGMAYAGTRTAYFIFTAGAVIYLLMTIMNRSTLITACGLVMLFAVIMWGPIYGNATVNRIRSTFNTDDSSLEVRDMNRANIQPYIHSHPIGGGLATSGVQGLQYNPGHFLAGFPPDSGFVKSAVETGWVGLFLQCALYCLILLAGLRVYYQSQDKVSRNYCLATVVTLFSFVISQYGQVSIGQIPDCFLFYSLLAIIVRLRKFQELNATNTN